MQGKLQSMLEQIKELEKSVEEEVRRAQKNFSFEIANRKVVFEKEALKKQKQFRQSIFRFLSETLLLKLLAAPLVYLMFFPAVILDISVTLAQFFWFPIYGIPKAKRRDYIAFDRHKLKYLNLIQKFNCVYCGYFNGVIAYARETAAKAEQHWCPIKHALKLKGLHPGHRDFLPYGDAEAYKRACDDKSKLISN